MITINQQNCNGCGTCLNACSVGAIYLVDRKAEVDQSLCTSCGNCIEVCPMQAIQLVADVVATPQPAPAIQSGRTLFWPTLKASVVTLGSTLAPILISKIGDVIISALESKPGQSALPQRRTSASGKRTRRRYRGGV
jgi:Fe-S-cluster-containing hydrogenase component 2